MKLIDLTKSLDRKKGARVSYTTIYKNKNMFGITSSVGIGFVKWIKGKNHLQVTANKRVKWYSSGSNAIAEAITQVRKWYSIKLETKGWSKMKVKAFNFTDINELIKTLIQNEK